MVDKVHIGMRADEEYRGDKVLNLDKKYEIQLDLMEEGLGEDDVIKLCEKHGMLNPVYEWRDRCGCFCCPMQSRSNWLGLYHRHYDLYAIAEEWELMCIYHHKELAENDDSKWTWNQHYSLTQLRMEEECYMKAKIGGHDGHLFEKKAGERNLLSSDNTV
jgi:hypothetical protein